MRLLGWGGMMAGCMAVLAGCSDSTGMTGSTMELEQARRIWESRGADDYEMTVRLTGAWIGGSAVIRVRDGVPVSVQARDGVSPGLFEQYDTVEDLFGVLQRALDQDASRIDAEFHPLLGLPVNAYIDQHENAIDDEHGFLVESFERQ